MGLLGRFLDVDVRADVVDELLRANVRLFIVRPVVELRKLQWRWMQLMQFGLLRHGKLGLVRPREQLWFVRQLRIVWMLELRLLRQLRVCFLRRVRLLRVQFLQRLWNGAVLWLLRQLQWGQLRAGLCQRKLQRRIVCRRFVWNRQLCGRCASLEAGEQPADS